jgi:hypothetical protein
MSFQAMNWAVKQKTGSPQAKLLLLLLANRADEAGICWPSQLGLSAESEQSDDTVQRHLKAMEGKFIRRARSRRTMGRWAGYVYQLLIPDAEIDDKLLEKPERKRAAREVIRTLPAAENTADSDALTRPQRAARSTPLSAASPHRSLRLHQAAESGVEPSIEPPIKPTLPEPSPATSAATPLPRPPRPLRPLARQRSKLVRLDLIHSQIAGRLGDNGWTVLQAMKPDDLAQIEGMQRRGELHDKILFDLIHQAKISEAGEIVLRSGLAMGDAVADLDHGDGNGALT